MSANQQPGDVHLRAKLQVGKDQLFNFGSPIENEVEALEPYRIDCYYLRYSYYQNRKDVTRMTGMLVTSKSGMSYYRSTLKDRQSTWCTCYDG